ncbi:MAG: lysylphosphatidylglycerol synthase transmembrane domain-containing protein [bacterium]
MKQPTDGVHGTPRQSLVRRFGLRFLISIGIGGILIYFAFRGLRPSELAAAFRRADYLWILPFFATLVGVQFFRAWRWRFLLQPITRRPPGVWRLLVVSSVGFGAIILLPLRLGEFVRPYLIADPLGTAPEAATGANGERLRISAALGTIAVERTVDGLMVSLFLFGSFLFLSERADAPAWMMPTAYTALAVFGSAALFLVAGLIRPRFAIALALTLSLIAPLAHRFGGRFERLRARLADLLGGLISGFSALASAGCLTKFVAASLVYWIFNGLGFYALAQAFHLDLTLVGAYALCGMVAIGIILPAGPGLVGNFHEFGKFGLQISLPAAVIRAEGMAFIVLAHGLQFLWYAGIALVALRSRHARFARVLKATVDGSAEESG